MYPKVIHTGEWFVEPTVVNFEEGCRVFIY